MFKSRLRRASPSSSKGGLCKSNLVLDIITAGGKTVAIRILFHPVPVALAEGLGVPIIVGTSVNLSGKPSALTAMVVDVRAGENLPWLM